MKIDQHIVTLKARRRGFHLITEEVVGQLPGLAAFSRGIAHLHLLHTSASLSLNENTDPDVAVDLETIFSGLVGDGGYRHSMEGEDDMSAHGKSSILGVSLLLPIRDGSLLLGTWQGIYLCEHRESGGKRRMAVTLLGE